MTLALSVDPDAFLVLQDNLLADIEDKSSGEARIILQRKIDFNYIKTMAYFLDSLPQTFWPPKTPPKG
jgi:hypothetical protein